MLSYEEANKYLDVTYDNRDNLKSRVSPTEYAKANGARTSNIDKTEDGNAAGWWWLRSPGSNPGRSACVHYIGTLIDGSVPYEGVCVRPALWINLEYDVF